MSKLSIRLLALTLAAWSAAQAGVLHDYKFDSNADDSVGSANGTLVGGALVSGGILTLDGIDDAVTLGSHIVPTFGDYSVALDFRLNGSQSGITEFISQGSSNGPGFYIGTNGSGFRLGDQWGSPSGAVLPADANWHRAVLVVDSSDSNAFFYLDGILASSLGAAYPNTTNAGDDTAFGMQFSNNGEHFKGDLDNIRIYDSALSANQVNNLDSAATPEPSSLALGATGLLLLLVQVGRRKRTA